MAQITTIKPDGSTLDTPPLPHTEARELFEALNKDGSDNVYVLHFI